MISRLRLAVWGKQEGTYKMRVSYFRFSSASKMSFLFHTQSQGTSREPSPGMPLNEEANQIASGQSDSPIPVAEGHLPAIFPGHESSAQSHDTAHIGAQFDPEGVDATETNPENNNGPGPSAAASIDPNARRGSSYERPNRPRPQNINTALPTPRVVLEVLPSTGATPRATNQLPEPIQTSSSNRTIRPQAQSYMREVHQLSALDESDEEIQRIRENGDTLFWKIMEDKDREIYWQRTERTVFNALLLVPVVYVLCVVGGRMGKRF